MDVKQIIENLPEFKQLLQSYKDKYQSLMNDYENLKRRTKKEKEDNAKYQDEHLLLTLAPAISNMWYAMQNSDYEHIILPLYTSFVNALQAVDISIFPTKQLEIFRDDMMEAIGTVPAPAPQYVNRVQSCVAPGFSIKGKVVIYAKVIVFV